MTDFGYGDGRWDLLSYLIAQFCDDKFYLTIKESREVDYSALILFKRSNNICTIISTKYIRDKKVTVKFSFVILHLITE